MGAVLNGAQGGLGGSVSNYGGAGLGGHGGGSVFGGVSQGGGGGSAESNADLIDFSFANGGSGGDVTSNVMTISDTTFNGAEGGAGGAVAGRFYAGGGAGGAGYGGGSVFGGISQGGAGGFASIPLASPLNVGIASTNGGNGGAVARNRITIMGSMLNGAVAGDGGSVSIFGGAGAGGYGGGSVFGGVSQGGAAGYSVSSTNNSPSIANGGAGGNVTDNIISITDSELKAANGGVGGATAGGGAGLQGYSGGSVFGGISQGGAGGYARSADASSSANGGRGGDVWNNKITISGTSKITGDIYGGISRGGDKGTIEIGPSPAEDGQYGLGGLAYNNTISLIGQNIVIGGAIYGGESINGANVADDLSAFIGNTLNLSGYKGSVQGVYNIENYNWTLPADVLNRDVLIDVRGNDLVDLNNTKHTVAMFSDGNRLNVRDEVVLISKAQGNHQPTRTEVQQGYFIIYDALLEINDSDEFVLRIDGKEDVTPLDPGDLPGGRLNPTSKALLQGRTAALAMINQGAGLLNEQLTECATDLFLIGNGGSSRYSTGSSVKVSDQRMAIGGRKCFELADASSLMLGVFAEHGTGNYHSSNNVAAVGKVRGHGDVRYTGGGLVMHMDYGSTGTKITLEPVLASPGGLYSDVVLRAGNIKTDFASNEMVDVSGKRAEYKSQSHYASVAFGAGYVWNLDQRQQVDLYARYSRDRLASDKVKVGSDTLRFGTDHSSRFRIGTRYHYAVTSVIAPYAGIAYEHEFDGKASGKVFEFDIDQTELKGGSGLLEVGVKTLAFGNDSAWQLDAVVQGYAGTRKGASGTLTLKYDF